MTTANKPRDWRWVDLKVVHAIHETQLAHHGGGDGVRDPGALESACARAANLAFYAEPDAAELAAAYAYGIAKNHAFVDGNKRTAWVVARVFLADNGCRLTFQAKDAVTVMEQVAGGSVTEEQLALWFRQRLMTES